MSVIVLGRLVVSVVTYLVIINEPIITRSKRLPEQHHTESHSPNG